MSSPAPPLDCPHCGTPVRAGARYCRSCGGNLTGAAASEPEAAPEQSRLTRLWRWVRSSRRRQLVIVGVLAVAVASTTFVTVQETSYGPEHQVGELFAALARGDGPAVRAMGACKDSPVCALGGLGEGYEPPTELQIKGVRYGAPGDDPTRRSNGNRATVQLSYRVGGKAYDDEASLVRNDGAFRGWTFTKPLGGYFTLTSPVKTEAKVAGARVSVANQGSGSTRTKQLWVVPGVYTVVAASTGLFDSTPMTVTVAGPDTSDGGPGIALSLTYKVAVLDEINRQVAEYLDECAKQPVAHPRISNLPGLVGGCPFQEDDYEQRWGQTRDIQWRITRYPQLKVGPGKEHPIDVSTAEPGVATVTLDFTPVLLDPSPRDWKRVSRDIRLVVDGHARLDDNDPDQVIYFRW